MIGKPKFNYGDIVAFQLKDGKYKGEVHIIDKYGTFENPNEPSYDILVKDAYKEGDRYYKPNGNNDCLFKHISEHMIITKKIYISLPIKIDEKTVAKRFKEAKEYISKLSSLKDYVIVGPININDFDDTGLTATRDHDYAWYMGEDIKVLLRCDAIFMGAGWEKSEGCRCELATAKIYNKEIIYQHC